MELRLELKLLIEMQRCYFKWITKNMSTHKHIYRWSFFHICALDIHDGHMVFMHFSHAFTFKRFTVGRIHYYLINDWYKREYTSRWCCDCWNRPVSMTPGARTNEIWFIDIKSNGNDLEQNVTAIEMKSMLKRLK